MRRTLELCREMIALKPTQDEQEVIDAFSAELFMYYADEELTGLSTWIDSMGRREIIIDWTKDFYKEFDVEEGVYERMADPEGTESERLGRLYEDEFGRHAKILAKDTDNCICSVNRTLRILDNPLRLYATEQELTVHGDATEMFSGGDFGAEITIIVAKDNGHAEYSNEIEGMPDT